LILNKLKRFSSFYKNNAEKNQKNIPKKGKKEFIFRKKSKKTGFNKKILKTIFDFL